jgi:antirestriction protein ArdC
MDSGAAGRTKTRRALASCRTSSGIVASITPARSTFGPCRTDDAGEETEREISFMKGYTVFNAEQYDGLPTFLCADLEITPEVREDHAAYILSWIAVLMNDKRSIFSAAAHAQRAVDYLHSLQPQPTGQQWAAA